MERERADRALGYHFCSFTAKPRMMATDIDCFMMCRLGLSQVVPSVGLDFCTGGDSFSIAIQG